MGKTKKSCASACAAILNGLLEAMTTGDLESANGLVYTKRNGLHMLMLWTRCEESSMGSQRDAITGLIPAALLPTVKMSFKSHAKARNRNTKEEVLSASQAGHHARTASLEVHCDVPDSDYSTSTTTSPSSQTISENVEEESVLQLWLDNDCPEAKAGSHHRDMASLPAVSSFVDLAERDI